MKYERKVHTIDIVFPMIVLLLFCSCALAVALEGAGIYEKTAAGFQKNYTARTAITYLQEKIRECGDISRVELRELDDRQVLILSSTYGKEEYATYIYMDQGKMKELFIKDEAVPHLEAGQELMSLDSFQVTKESENLFKFRIFVDGQEETTFVSVNGVVRE